MIAMSAPPDPGAPRRVRRVVRRPAAAAAARLPEPEDPGRLLRPAAACPRCGARPAMRITRQVASALSAQPAGMRVGTYQCQRRGCGAIYDLFVEAYVGAS